MKKNLWAVTAALLILGGSGLWAQGANRRTDLMGTPVTFQANVPGVSITINSTPYNGALPQTINFQPGTYALVAKANGFQDFTTTFTVVQGRAQTVTIGMQTLQPVQPAMAQITFTSNAPNTTLTFSNSRLSRPLPQTVTAAPGTYQITAEAPGFQSLTTTITVTGSTTIPLTLQGASFPITFVSNVNNTRITVDGNRINRPLPQTVQLNVGTHQVVASSPGYQDSILTIEVTGGAQTVNVILQPQVSQVRAQGVQVYIDGVLQTGEVFDVEPGRRTVRVVAGNYSAEQVHNFVAGRTYDITPSFSFTIR